MGVLFIATQCSSSDEKKPQNLSSSENPQKDTEIAHSHGGGGGGGGGGGHGHGGGGGGGGHWGGGGGGHWGGHWGGGHWGGGGWGGGGGGNPPPSYYPPQGGYVPPPEPRINIYTFTVEDPENPSEPGEEEPGIDDGGLPGDDGVQEAPGGEGPGGEELPPEGEEPQEAIDIDTLIDLINQLLNGLGIDITTININIDNGTIDFGGDTGWGSYWGYPGASSAPLADEITQQHIVTKDNPRNIKGCYQTTYGILRLHIKDNNNVTGSYHYKGKVQYLKGKLKDNILAGVWMENIHGKQAGKVGTFQFAFQPKWASFKGLWGNKGDKKLTHTWDGKKIKCPLPKKKEASKDTKPKDKSQEGPGS